jgi:hypothetical protein
MHSQHRNPKGDLYRRRKRERKKERKINISIHKKSISSFKTHQRSNYDMIQSNKQGTHDEGGGASFFQYTAK